MFFIRSFAAMYNYVNEAITTLTLYVDARLVSIQQAILLCRTDLTTYIDEAIAAIPDPYISQCSVYLTESQVIPEHVHTKVLFDGKLYDNNNEFVVSPDYKFIAKAETGIYHISVQIYLLGVAASICSIYIRVNGVTVKMNTSVGLENGICSLCIYADVKLDVDDYIEIMVRHDTDSEKSVSEAITNTYMDIHRIS
ncbi:hypothetical protein ES705_31142 [subsurface metagenome]